MADLLTKKLSAEDFNAEKFVQELSQNSVGHLDLHEQRQKIHQLSENTNAQLKKNVYMNYMQFIETAKEISYLESEMYQLSHLITEQKSLLSSLLEVSISGEKGPGTSVQEMPQVNLDDLKAKREKENRKKLTVLLEKIEGCSHILEAPNRHLIYDSDLVELNQDDYSANQRVHAYLLNDSLMLATWLSDRRGPIRYKFENLFLLDQVLPVNIKDRGTTKNSFKVLIFPDTRVFQAPSSKTKQDWLDEIERTKSNKVANEKAKVEAVQHKERQSSLSKDDSIDSNNPFGAEDDDSPNPFAMEAPPVVFAPPEWIHELPEDLDQATAQRNFEDAVTLIGRGREYFQHANNNTELAQMKRALESRVNVLIDVLESELKVTPEKSLQGGPRAARRATNLLVQLGHSMKACKLFLKYRSELLKIGLKRLRLEGKTALYIQQLCTVFFHNLVEAGKEFNKAFPTAQHCRSSFVVWVSDEVKSFSNIFTRHVFTTQTSLSTISECILYADQHCSQLTTIGLDLLFALHSHLLRDVEKWISDGRDKMVEAVKLRAQEDSWKDLTFENRDQFDKFLGDMNDIGIPNVKSYAVGDNCISLTDNVIQFSRAFLSYLEDVLKLTWPETSNLLDESLTAVFSAQLRHCRNSLDDPLFAGETAVIQRNSCFLLDVVLSVGEHRYAETTGYPHPVLHTFHALRPSLMAHHPTKTTVNKYESPFL